MIGIGVTTYKRQENLKECLEKIKLHTKCPYKIYVATDTDEDRKGVAARKNECLQNLKDCEYVFLYDDDCFPISNDYVNFFIEAHKQTGEHHFNFCVDNLHKLKNTYFVGDFTINVYEQVGGVFLFFTKEVIKKVGAFGRHFDLYGLEHVAYSIRCYEAGLTTDYFTSLENTKDYVFSHDYFTPNLS